MSTAQIYAGSGKTIPASVQTAKNQARTPLQPHDHQRDLFALLDDFVNEASAAHSVQTLLNATYDRLAAQIGADPERDVNDGQTFTIHEQDLSELFSGMRLAYFVAAIKEKWTLVRTISERKGGQAHA